MLNETQVTRVWEGMLSAEARSLYFADLASKYTVQKQWIAGLSFFLSSAVAVSLLAKAQHIDLLTFAAFIVGILNAYSIAVGLDGKIGTMVKLHSAWREIATAYDDLWNHPYEDGSENAFTQIIRLERDPTELATTAAPNDERLMAKWQDRVFTSYHIG